MAFDLSRRASLFDAAERQNRIKHGGVMPIKIWGKSGVLAYLGPKISHFGHIFEIFVLPFISNDIKGPTKLEVNRTQIDHFSLKKHKNSHISKSHFAEVSITKKPNPPTFFHEFV